MVLMTSKPVFSSLGLLLLLVQEFCIQHVGSASETTFFNDPQIVQGWAFKMINVLPVWQQGIFGKGSRVRVNDQGVDYLHKEFQGRFDVNGSCKVFDAKYDEEEGKYEQHGTTVASIIGAAGNNGQCAVGIAPEVTLSSCQMFSSDVEDGSFYTHKLDSFDISQNSYNALACRPHEDFTLKGTFAETSQCPFTYRPIAPIVNGDGESLHPCDTCVFPSENQPKQCRRGVENHCIRFYENDKESCSSLLGEMRLNGECAFAPPFAFEAMAYGAEVGRDGKGIIYVFGAGNYLASGGNTNFDLQGRYIIFVGAVGKDEQSTGYSSPGTSLLLTAPGGDFDDSDSQRVAKVRGSCQGAGRGTSFSSPIVSGVIALMLEVNPNLSWRDVQGILATTSRPVTHTVYDDYTQTTNGAGLVHSNLYGFGIVDAAAAVVAAESWISYDEEQLLKATAIDLDLDIGDDPNQPLSTTLEIGSEGSALLVENVEIDIYFKHSSRGHLQITLESPHGTISELLPGSIPENGQNNNPWTLRTVRNWGEVPVGAWRLSIVDMVDGDVGDCVDHPDFETKLDGLPVSCDLLESLPRYHDKRFVNASKVLLDREIDKHCCACGGGTVTGDNDDICEDIPYDPNVGNLCIALDCECVGATIVDNADVACEGIPYDPGLDHVCDSLERAVCENNTIASAISVLGVMDSTQNRSIQEACCVVGGGIAYNNDTTTFRDQLLGWELRVYAHSDPSKTRTPTLTPSDPPKTSAPTLTPSSITAPLVPSIMPFPTDDTAFRQTNAPTDTNVESSSVVTNPSWWLLVMAIGAMVSLLVD